MAPGRAGARGLRSPAVAHRVTLIPGDGIGPEVAAATQRVVAATGVEIDWVVQDAGEPFSPGDRIRVVSDGYRTRVTH